MRGIPDCLNRRYRAVDELVNELSSSMSDRRSSLDSPGHDSQEPGIKLMCNFWNILKEAPDCNLPQAVQQRMCTNEESCASCCIPAQRFSCYMARSTKKPMLCCRGSKPSSGRDTPVSVTPDGNEDLPINKVLGHLKVAASFDKKCTERLNNLLATEKLLKTQIEGLEIKEKDGVILLRKADCMWSCMDEAYKERIVESNERQKILQKQLKEIEASANKWRKNKKDLESQLDTLNKQEIEVKDKINQKKNDIKYLDMEIAGFKKRIEGNKTETKGTKNSLSNKKKTSDAKIASITTKVTKLEAALKEERKRKQERDEEGANYIKEAREELQKICRVLLQKKLENEDRTAEKEGILLEIYLLQETCKKCKEKCENKQLTIGAEINKIDAEIAAFKTRCVQCHECIDTSDVRKLCTDCPKCAGDRECIMEGDHCDADHSFDCVCQMVKRKFLDNVFDNMYTVLERQSKAGPGKAVAEAVMNCLKKSRNGKLNEETRKILQDFVLTTVKKNLNLTIVGGAVKTRCEMDAETYKQLMVCLKQVRVTHPPKADKGTNAKKDACRSWGGTSECHCPKGPKSCICTRKAPPPPNDPDSCPPPPQDKEDAGEKVQCPLKKSTACGVDCGMHQPSSIATEVVKWRPDPCQGPSCKFPKNMRAAQCIVGPESLSSVTTQSYKSALPDMSLFDSQVSCKCGASSSKKPCTCFGVADSKQLKAEESGEFYTNFCPVTWEEWSDVSPHVKLAVKDDGIDVDTEFYASDAQSAKIYKTWKVPIDQNKKKPEVKVRYSNSMPEIMKKEFSISISDKNTVPRSKSFNNTDMLTNSQSSNVEFSNIVSLTHTTLGGYVIELDEKMISQINQKSTKDPVMFVGIKETVSGQRKLVFNPPSNMSLIRSLVTKTPSGSISLYIDKSMVKTLLPGNERIVDVEDGKSIVSIGIKRRHTQIKNEKSNEQQSFYNKQEYGSTTEQSGSSYNKKNIKNDSEYYTTVTEKINNKQQLNIKNDIEIVFKSKKQKEGTETSFQPSLKNQQKRYFSLADLVNSENEDVYNYRQELKKIYNEHTGSIKMRIQDENGGLGFIKADVTKTSSGNVALDLINVSSIGEISSKTRDHPVLLKRSSLGTYTLFVARRRNIKAPNAVLRRTSSERVLVIITTPIIKSMSRSNTVSRNVGREPKLFKIRTKGNMCGNIPLQTSLLKLTPSGNYILVLDKEFEIQHTNTIQKVIGIESESYVELSKMDSDTVVINFDRSNDYYSNNQNAVIVKSPSGHLKLYVSGPIFENLSKRMSNVDYVKQKSFEELLLKPLARESKKLRDNCTKYGMKCVSETNLNEKIRIKLQLRDGIFAVPSTTLKRTPSVESKKTFVNDLKNFLAHSSHDRIPIKTSDDGEITIVLNGENESKEQYGSLKITPSGNIYVLVQESVLQKITKNKWNKHFGITDLGSEHLIKKIVNPENKCVATNCSAKPDDELCDASKCVCEKIKDSKNMFYSGKEDKLKLLKKKCGISLKTKSSTVCCSSSGKINVSPHIVIKPCNCNIGKTDQNRNKQCYYVFDSVCPLHKKTRYDNVSNEILEISGLCKYFNNRDSRLKRRKP